MSVLKIRCDCNSQGGEMWAALLKVELNATPAVKLQGIFSVEKGYMLFTGQHISACVVQ